VIGGALADGWPPYTMTSLGL